MTTVAKPTATEAPTQAVERYEPQPLERLTTDQVKFIANTEIVPKALRGNPAAIIAVILKGRALGLDDIHAMSAIHFIEGKPTLAAETMMMLARRAGHSITVKADVDSATAKGKRADNGDAYEVTWTMEDATRAGLTGKDNWKRHPRQMLSWRATSELCRVLFPDVLAGTGYTPEELERSPEEVAADALRVTPSASGGDPDDDWIDGEVLAEEPGPSESRQAQDLATDVPEPFSAEERVEGHDGVLAEEPEPVFMLDAAPGSALIPEGRYKGQRLDSIDARWIEYALKKDAAKWPAEFLAALELYAQAEHPETYLRVRSTP